VLDLKKELGRRGVELVSYRVVYDDGEQLSVHPSEITMCRERERLLPEYAALADPAGSAAAANGAGLLLSHLGSLAAATAPTTAEEVPMDTGVEGDAVRVAAGGEDLASDEEVEVEEESEASAEEDVGTYAATPPPPATTAKRFAVSASPMEPAAAKAEGKVASAAAAALPDAPLEAKRWVKAVIGTCAHWPEAAEEERAVSPEARLAHAVAAIREGQRPQAALNAQWNAADLTQ
jgi:hypothetical protein